MGSCLSVTRRRRSAGRNGTDLHNVAGPGPDSVPPFPEEELVVKEVLSETPKPSSAYGAKPVFTDDGVVKIQQHGDLGSTGDRSAPAKEVVVEEEKQELEASEICSMSETVSVSTTITEEESSKDRPMVRSRSPAPKQHQMKRHNHHHRQQQQQQQQSESTFTSRRDRRCSTPDGGRRSSPSPARRPAASRTVSRAEHVKGGFVGRSRGGGGPVESCRSVRRSPSPAPTRATTGENDKVGRSKISVIRRRNPSEASLHLGEEKEEEGNGRKAELGESMGGSTLGDQQPEESLENPLVSLECFIFL